MSGQLKEAVFNDCDYRILSTNEPVTLEHMKNFDRFDIYNDRAYKILNADKAVDVGLYEEKVCKNGKVRKVKSKAVLKQKIIISFSGKKNDGISTLHPWPSEKGQKNYLKTSILKHTKKGLMMLPVLLNVYHPQNPAKRSRTVMKLTRVLLMRKKNMMDFMQLRQILITAQRILLRSVPTGTKSRTASGL